VVKYLADRHFKARQGRRETVMRERCSGSIIMVAIAGTAAVISVSTDRSRLRRHRVSPPHQLQLRR
jgi:hypothetical protein